MGLLGSDGAPSAPCGDIASNGSGGRGLGCEHLLFFDGPTFGLLRLMAAEPRPQGALGERCSATYRQGRPDVRLEGL